MHPTTRKTPSLVNRADAKEKEDLKKDLRKIVRKRDYLLEEYRARMNSILALENEIK